jgi:nucleotide-binding universal stress UspA family protein
MGRIVVGIDGSAASVDALRHAVTLAGALSAEVDAVHTWHMGYAATELSMVPTPARGDIEAAARRVLEDAIRAVGEHEVTITPIVAEGDAAATLLDAAEVADMLVVGSRGHGGFVGLLLGSVSHKVISHAPCPVLVVPDRR